MRVFVVRPPRVIGRLLAWVFGAFSRPAEQPE